MRCLKCGVETPDNHVFCDNCLETMVQYPIKPGTPIQLPPKQPKGPEKHAAPENREPTTAEQLGQLRRMIRWLTAIIVLLSVLLCGTAVMLLRAMDDAPGAAPPSIGKNYTTTGAQNQP